MSEYSYTKKELKIIADIENINVSRKVMGYPEFVIKFIGDSHFKILVGEETIAVYRKGKYMIVVYIPPHDCLERVDATEFWNVIINE